MAKGTTDSWVLLPKYLAEQLKQAINMLTPSSEKNNSNPLLKCENAVAKLLPSCCHFLRHNFENQQQHQQLLSGHQPVKHQLVSRLITDRQWLDSGPIKSLLLYVKVLNFPSTLPSLRCPPNTVMRIPTRTRWLFLSNPSVLFSSVPWLFFPRCPMHPLPLSAHCHATSSMIFFQRVFLAPQVL